MHYLIGCLVVVVGIVVPLVILAVIAFAYIAGVAIVLAVTVGLYKAVICYIKALKRTLTSNTFYEPGNFLKAVVIAFCIPTMIIILIITMLNIGYMNGIVHLMPEGTGDWTDAFARWAVFTRR